MNTKWSSAVPLLIAAAAVHAQNYAVIPRWGQASAIIYDTLFISGGKTDPAHQYTYSSAPNSNDLLSLDLTAPFSLSSPPWSYVSGSQNTSTSQGPAVSFHTLTPYTSSDLLLFGGDAGFSVIETNADSAWLLSANNPLVPTWTSQSAGWASEPIRRVYHAATSASGAIYILGGQKGDGSQIGFPDSYLFNAVSNNGSPGFGALSNTDNAPPSLFGHTAHVLPGGTLLVFGGFSSGSSPIPSPLNMIYTLDTTSSSPIWSIQNASGGTTPTPRRGFTSVMLDNGKILIHGGADATLQTIYSDGALLDTSQSPMTWSPINALSNILGPRVGHFAAPIQGHVLFGFGWAGNTAANANLVLYDPTSNTFEPTYTPAPTPISITTLPVSPTAPGGTYPISSVSVVQSGTNTNGAPAPTHTGSGSTSGSSTEIGPNGGGSGGDGGEGRGGQDGAHPESKASLSRIIIGGVFGFFALVVLVASGVYYAHRRRDRRAWMGVDATVKMDLEGRSRLMPVDESWNATADGSPTQPGERLQMAGTGWQGPPRRRWGLLGIGALTGSGGASANGNRARHRRFDMLADEDARQFDAEHAFDPEDAKWEYSNASPHPRRDGSEGSSVSFGPAPGPSTWSSVLNASLTSLRNVSVALRVPATGTVVAEVKGRSSNPPEWQEKSEMTPDPFSDTAASLEMDTNPLMGMQEMALRPRGGGYSSESKASNPYVDPDLEGERDVMDAHDEGTTALFENSHNACTLRNAHDTHTKSTLSDSLAYSSHDSLPRSIGMLGLARIGTSSLGTSERGGGGSTSVESHDAPSSSMTNSNPGFGTSHTSSNDHSSCLSSPTSPRTTSIIGATGAPNAPMRRSDSWWSRFSRTSFRDRHSFHDPPRPVEFRDPNPAPRLGPIQESPQSSAQTTQEAIQQPSGSGSESGMARAKRKEGSGYASSIKTDHTADSELIERMGGKMEVVQRALSFNSRGTMSPSTATESPEIPDQVDRWGLSPVEASGSNDSRPRSWVTGTDADMESAIVESPKDEADRHSGEVLGNAKDRARDPGADPSSPCTATNPAPTMSSNPDADLETTPLSGPHLPRRARMGAVAARVSAYERRMTQDALVHSGPRSSPTATKAAQKDKVGRTQRSTVGYGLVPKAPLFVANPDRRKPSGSS